MYNSKEWLTVVRFYDNPLSEFLFRFTIFSPMKKKLKSIKDVFRNDPNNLEEIDCDSNENNP